MRDKPDLLTHRVEIGQASFPASLEPPDRNHMNSTIIARITGGLGNQLFIYAAARRIAEERGARLLVDSRSAFQTDKYGAIYQLDHFAIAAEKAPLRDCFVSPSRRRRREFFKFLSKTLPARWKPILKEADFIARPGTTPDYRIPLRRKIWLEGYWQSARYFRPIEAEIRRELTVISPLSEQSREIAAAIAGANAVALHVRQRRGAALAPGMPDRAVLPQLPFSYYERAIAAIAARVADPVFFCFADEPGYLPPRWRFSHPIHYVSHNVGQDLAHQDFALMAGCRHFICANSTFGWWPAFLGTAPDKIVVAPKSTGRLTWSGSPDILPDDWIALDPE
ncbi:MAG: alpha-1,2-fucosyltransferase [Stellaceae bacterium]